MKTDRQTARQQARSNGRYQNMNRCEACARSLGVGYFSDPRLCNDGYGLVLCERCCQRGMEMDEPAARAFYRSARG